MDKLRNHLRGVKGNKKGKNDRVFAHIEGELYAVEAANVCLR
jgi:hypothetical protein